jgi:hypothetical protein
MPAPAFLVSIFPILRFFFSYGSSVSLYAYLTAHVQVKKLVDIFVDRAELMAVDETIEQHKERRKEEGDAVEVDRATQAGLFKGCFPNKQPVGHLRMNDERIIECTECGAEYVSGTMCEHCGIDFEGDEEEFNTFSDIDGIASIEGYDVEFEGDLDPEDEDDEDDYDEHEDVNYPPNLWPTPSDFRGHVRTIHSALDVAMGRRRRSGSHSSSEGSAGESMDNFIDDDEIQFENGHANSPDGSTTHSTASSRRPETRRTDGDADDSDDEGGAVSNGRRRARLARAPPRGTPSVTTATDESVISELDDYVSRHLQDGWSPLDQDQDSDGDQQPFIDHGSNDDSDTDTMVGNHVSDEDEDSRHSENDIETPRWEESPRNPYIHQTLRSQSVQTTTSHVYGNAWDSEVQGTNAVDLEGDVEMSVTSGGSRRGSSASIGSERRQRSSAEILGSATTIQEAEEDSSDTSVQPAVRRRRGPSRPSQTPEYDHRITMMLAQHQSDLRDVTARQSPYFEDRARAEPVLRSRISSHRLLPPRRSAVNIIHSSSGAILTPATTRPGRVQRQYSRRHAA